MRIALTTICCILLATGSGLCDSIDERLPSTLPQELKDNARQMIAMGLDVDDTVDLIDTMLQHQFEVSQILQAQSIIIKSRQSGLPAQPLASKAYEGISKQVPAKNILAAMEQVYSRYAFAYTQVGSISPQKAQTGELGNLLAGGLAAGLNQDDARKIMTALDARRRDLNSDQATHLARESLSTVRDIARFGVTSQAATAVVVQALERGLSPQEIAVVHGSFLSQSPHTDPQKLAKSYSQGIMSGRSVQGLGVSEGARSGHQGQGSPAGTGGAGGAGDANGGGAGGAGAGGGAGGGAGMGAGGGANR